MKLNTVTFAQVIRTLKISGSGGGNIYALNLTKACEQRYGFLQGPRTLAEFDLSKGVTFLHGYFEQRLVIDRFQVFSDGIIAEAKADTDEISRFVDDVIEWVSKEAKVVFDDKDSKNFYASHIECELDFGLPNVFQEFHHFGKNIADVMRSYGHAVPDFVVSYFGFAADTTASFKIERRDGTAPEARTYFCTAPLRTSDQVKLLKAAEKMLSPMTSA